MRSEAEVRENLEWMKIQCRHFRENEKARVVNQIALLLWVLGDERVEAQNEAEAIWQIAREGKGKSPQDY